MPGEKRLTVITIVEIYSSRRLTPLHRQIRSFPIEDTFGNRSHSFGRRQPGKIKKLILQGGFGFIPLRIFEIDRKKSNTTDSGCDRGTEIVVEQIRFTGIIPSPQPALQRTFQRDRSFDFRLRDRFPIIERGTDKYRSNRTAAY